MTPTPRICSYFFAAVLLLLLSAEVHAAGASSCTEDGEGCFMSSFLRREENLRMKLDSLLLRLNGLVNAVHAMQSEVVSVLQDLGECRTNHPRRNEIVGSAQSQEKSEQAGDGKTEQGESVKESENLAQDSSEENGGQAAADAESYLAPPGENAETFGARLIMPVEQEVLHVNAPHYVMELFTPARGDALVEISIDNYVVVKIDLLCSFKCSSSGGNTYVSSTGGRSEADSCQCQCTRNCDCGRCMRSTYSEMVRIEGDVIQPGQHSLTVDLMSGQPRTKQILQTFFFVVPEWLTAFSSFLNETATVRSLSPNVMQATLTAPAHALPGLTYSMPPGHAVGAGALWPGIAIRRPRAGEVFRQHSGVRVELELLDFEWEVDGSLQASIVSQINDGSCAGFYGCPLSRPLPLQEVMDVQSRHSRWELQSVQDCSLVKIESLQLLPGFYRLQVYLTDRDGRQMSSIRHRVFSVTLDAAGSGEEEQEGEEERWQCPKKHCGAEVRKVERPARPLSLLLLTEWPAIAGISASADRWRMMVDALWQLGHLVQVVSRNCAPYHGDYISKSHRGGGARSICGISSTDIPALLLELDRVDVVLMDNRFFLFPSARSIPQQWIPFLRESPRTQDARLVVVSDQLVRPNGTELDDASDRHMLHAAGAQLVGFAAADVIAVSTVEDLRWIGRVFSPGAPILLLRHSIVMPKIERRTPGFRQRKGILWIGGGVSYSAGELELISKRVLPMLEGEVGGGDSFVFVFDEERFPVKLPGVSLLEPRENLREAFSEFKVCLSFTMDGQTYFQPNLLHALAAGVPVVVLGAPPLGLHILPSRASCEDCPDDGPRCGWPHMSAMECEELGCCWRARMVRGSGPPQPLRAAQCRQPCAVEYPSGSGVVVIPRDKTFADSSSSGEEALRAMADTLTRRIKPLLRDEDVWQAESTAAIAMVRRHHGEVI
mmetsp:Transcript_20634/g.69029  ORF Transcript_20634/g.69029 Transcript_20634/m.69029 type:complete len:946 (-) Transcript_20634:1559-4396(-)